MKTFSKILTLAIIATIFSGNTFAQTIKSLGQVDDIKYYLVNDKNPTKIGKGVLIWVIQEYESFTSAERYYYSCDGKYTSSGAVGYVISTLDTNEERRAEILRSFKQANNFDTSSYSIEDIESVDHKLKNKIRVNLRELCANATIEKKGTFFPFFTSLYNKDQTANIVSIISGTFVRKSEFVEGWARSHRIINTEMKKNNGEIYRKKDGTPYMIDELKNDGYSMSKISVDCKKQEFAILLYSDHDKFGAQTSKSFTPSKPSYQIPIPNTQGESIVETFCRVY